MHPWRPLAIPLAAALGLAGAAATAQADVAPRSVVCGQLFDSRNGRMLGAHRLAIDTGRITALEPLAELPAALRPEELDLRAHACLPGLIDLHVHLTEQPRDTSDLTVLFRRTRAEQRVLSAAQASATLLAGFTTVRNVGAYIRGVDLALRDAINRGEVLGPRMQVSGFYLTIPGGGGDLLVPGVPEPATPLFVRSGVARGTEQFRRKAELALAEGADLLKVIASGAVLAFSSEPGAPEMNPAEIATVVQVAHAHGKRVAAHAHGARSVREAIMAGADTIEHASLIDAEGIRLARERGTVLVMDVYNGDYIDTAGRAQGWPAEFLRKNLETTEAQRLAFTSAVRAGATIAYGTDAGVFPHGDNARQFHIMAERGMSHAQALQAATWNAARAMGWEHDVGVLDAGYFADLVAVRGDVLANIRLLESVDVIIKGGHLVRGPSGGAARISP